MPTSGTTLFGTSATAVFLFVLVVLGSSFNACCGVEVFALGLNCANTCCGVAVFALGLSFNACCGVAVFALGLNSVVACCSVAAALLL